MADTPKHSVSVAGIVVDDQDRVLVIQRRDNGHWEPPGGVLELDESPQVGVAREVYEETGLTVVADRLSGVYKNMTRGVVSLVFRCSLVGGRSTTTAETLRVEWMTRDEVEWNMSKTYSIRVHDAFAHDVCVRTHDGSELLTSQG